MNVRHEFTTAQVEAPIKPRRLIRWAELLPGLVVLADLIVLMVCAAASYSLLIGSSWNVAEFYAFAAVFIALVTVLLLRSGGLYRTGAILSAGRSLDMIVISVVTAFVFLLTVLHAFKTSVPFQPDWFLAFALSSTVGLLVCRLGVASLLNSLLKQGKGRLYRVA